MVPVGVVEVGVNAAAIALPILAAVDAVVLAVVDVVFALVF